jgi:adenylate cyclase
MSEARKLAAILVSDVVGYSRLTGADEDRILARLRTLRSDLIDPTIAVHHGRTVKRTGDGSILEFRSVVDAVNCAIEVQRAMVERNPEVAPDKRIEFRIGIHLGDVVEENDGDLMGDGVNIAARLEGVAKLGAICLSEQVYWQVKGRLDLAVTDLGQTQLKNIAEPIRVYSLEVGVPAQTKRDAHSFRAAQEAFRALAARRRARGAPGCDRGRRVVVPQCEPARKRRCERARRGRAAFDSRAALRQPLWRSGAGLPRRRPDR